MRIFIGSMPLVALTAILSLSAVNHIDRKAAASANSSALPETVAIWRKMRATREQSYLHTRPKLTAKEKEALAVVAELS